MISLRFLIISLLVLVSLVSYNECERLTKKFAGNESIKKMRRDLFDSLPGDGAGNGAGNGVGNPHIHIDLRREDSGGDIIGNNNGNGGGIGNGNGNGNGNVHVSVGGFG